MGTLARTTGLLRSFESVGSTFAYVTSATHWKYMNTLILAFTLFVVQLPFTTTAAWSVPDHPHEINQVNQDQEGGFSTPSEDSIAEEHETHEKGL